MKHMLYLCAVMAIFTNSAYCANNEAQKGNRIQQYMNKKLLNSVSCGDIGAVKWWIRVGADVNATWDGGGSALTTAAWQGDYKMMKLLLARGACANGSIENDSAPAHWAARFSNDLKAANMIQLLSKYWANLSAKDSYGKTPRDIATGQGNEIAAKILTHYNEHKADIGDGLIRVFGNSSIGCTNCTNRNHYCNTPSGTELVLSALDYSVYLKK